MQGFYAILFIILGELLATKMRNNTKIESMKGNQVVDDTTLDLQKQILLKY